MAAAAMGLTPMLPVTSDAGTVEMPDLARMAKSPAVLRGTGSAAKAAQGHLIAPAAFITNSYLDCCLAHRTPLPRQLYLGGAGVVDAGGAGGGGGEALLPQTQW